MSDDFFIIFLVIFVSVVLGLVFSSISGSDEELNHAVAAVMEGKTVYLDNERVNYLDDLSYEDIKAYISSKAVYTYDSDSGEVFLYSKNSNNEYHKNLLEYFSESTIIVVLFIVLITLVSFSAFCKILRGY